MRYLREIYRQVRNKRSGSDRVVPKSRRQLVLGQAENCGLKIANRSFEANAIGLNMVSLFEFSRACGSMAPSGKKDRVEKEMHNVTIGVYACRSRYHAESLAAQLLYSCLSNREKGDARLCFQWGDVRILRVLNIWITWISI